MGSGRAKKFTSEQALSRWQLIMALCFGVLFVVCASDLWLRVQSWNATSRDESADLNMAPRLGAETLALAENLQKGWQEQDRLLENVDSLVEHRHVFAQEQFHVAGTNNEEGDEKAEEKDEDAKYKQVAASPKDQSGGLTAEDVEARRRAKLVAKKRVVYDGRNQVHGPVSNSIHKRNQRARGRVHDRPADMVRVAPESLVDNRHLPLHNWEPGPEVASEDIPSVFFTVLIDMNSGRYAHEAFRLAQTFARVYPPNRRRKFARDGANADDDDRLVMSFVVLVAGLDVVSEPLLQKFAELGVEVRVVPKLAHQFKDLDGVTPYINKLIAWMQPETKVYDWTVVLDCDILMLGDFWTQFVSVVLDGGRDKSVSISCRMSQRNPSQGWDRFLRHADLEQPPLKYRTVEGEPSIMYCNGGVILIQRDFVAPMLHRMHQLMTKPTDAPLWTQHALTLAFYLLQRDAQKDDNVDTPVYAPLPFGWNASGNPQRFTTIDEFYSWFCLDPVFALHSSGGSLDALRLEPIRRVTGLKSSLVMLDDYRRDQCQQIFADGIDRLRAEEPLPPNICHSRIMCPESEKEKITANLLECFDLTGQLRFENGRYFKNKDNGAQPREVTPVFVSSHTQKELRAMCALAKNAGRSNLAVVDHVRSKGEKKFDPAKPDDKKTLESWNEAELARLRDHFSNNQGTDASTDGVVENATPDAAAEPAASD